jgi:hypothetical protein
MNKFKFFMFVVGLAIGTVATNMIITNFWIVK